VAHAGHRLVEQHHLGVERQRRRDFEGALAAIGSSTAGVLSEIGKADRFTSRMASPSSAFSTLSETPEVE
jgi:hypothetical protein